MAYDRDESLDSYICWRLLVAKEPVVLRAPGLAKATSESVIAYRAGYGL